VRTISLDFGKIQLAQGSLNQCVLKASSVKGSINAVYIDSSIAARRNISSRLYRSTSKVQELEKRLRDIQSFMQDGAQQYQLAENAIIRQANIGQGQMVELTRYMGGMPSGQVELKLTPEQMQALALLGKMAWNALEWYAQWRVKMGQVQAAVPAEETKKKDSSWKVSWDLMVEGLPKAWDAIKDRGKSEFDGMVKTTNSLIGIGKDIYDQHVMRSEKQTDSWYDFFNHMTLGGLDGLVGTYEGAADRTAKKNDSFFDLGNYWSNGLLEMIKDARSPEDPLSKEHWESIIGIGSMAIPGMKGPRVPGKRSHHSDDGKGDGHVEGTGKTSSFKVSNESLDHANIGDFTKNPKTGEISKMSGGGHGQDNINFLERNGIEYNIEKTYSNGVRVGNVPDHKSKGKRTGTGQAWFPENWTKEEIGRAGDYVANMPAHKDIADGITIFGEYNGVRVGVIKTNGEIGTIFPDNMLQP